MNTRHRVIISLGGLILVALLFFIVFSERGLADLNWLRKEKRVLLERNASVSATNEELSMEIDRLKNDPDYIEQIARRELGMIGREEMIIKSRDSAGKKP
jgi:cell division protein FtsB